MNIFFSGIGGTGIGPLALIAKKLGYTVSGSDKQDSLYIENLKKHGISDINIGQTYDNIAETHQKTPIDWYVYSSAVAIEQPDAPEFQFCRDKNIKMSKRDEILNQILDAKKMKLIAVAGTHGKTTTTAMVIWVLKQLSLPIGYILPAKSSFAEMGDYEDGAEYFVYECDEFDRNFLHYSPHISIVTGIDWDHPDIFPTRQDYYEAFGQFMRQSDWSVMWQSDVDRLGNLAVGQFDILNDQDSKIDQIELAGHVNRRNAWQVAHTLTDVTGKSQSELLTILENFPGVSRRYEKIADGLYSDYAHTPEKIRGALQLGLETAKDRLVVIYEGLHNTRQHFIRQDLVNLFDDVKRLYIVPSYLAREDQSLPLLSPQDLSEGLSEASQSKSVASELNQELKDAISAHLEQGDTVLCLTAGGGGSLDEWLRSEFQS